MLDRPAFIKRFADEFELDGLVGTERLLDDLEFDSLELLRVALFLEIVCDVELPEQVDYESLCVDDIWHYYQVQATRRDETLAP